MSWTFGPGSSAGVCALLDKEETTVDAALDDPGFQQVVRNGAPALIRFLKRAKCQPLKDILDYAFTDREPSTSNKVKTVRSAVQLFSSNALTVVAFLKGSPEFIGRLTSFPESKFSIDPRICGHFQRVVESIVRSTSGEFLSSLPFLGEFLVHHMSVLALKELFVTLATDFPSHFPVTEDVALSLCKEVNGPNGFLVLSAIRGLFKTKVEFITPFCKIDSVRCLLSSAVSKSSSSVISIECFEVIEKIVGRFNSDEVNSALSSAESEFDFNSNHPLSVTAAAMRVFKTRNFSIVRHIFDNNGLTFLNECILSTVKSFNVEELNSAIESNGVLTSIISAASETKTNAHLFRLAEYLNSKSDSIPSLKDPKWSDFTSGGLQSHINLRDSAYGGGKPASPSEAHSDNDEEPGIAETAPCEDVDTTDLFGSGSSSSSNSDSSEDDEERSSPSGDALKSSSSSDDEAEGGSSLSFKHKSDDSDDDNKEPDAPPAASAPAVAQDEVVDASNSKTQAAK